MPVNHHLYAIPADQPFQDAQQTKYCSHCSSPFNADPSNTVFLLDDQDSNIFCGACRPRLRSARSESAGSTSIFVDHGRSVERPGLPNIDTSPDALSTYPSSEPFFEDDIETLTSPASTTDFSVSSSLLSSISSPSPLALATRAAPTLSPVNSDTHFPPTSAKPHRVQESFPDPSVDITRLRIRSQSYHCLYPGATFNGTQKSGRNSYDVTVTIVVRPIVPLPLRHYV